ncbi:hypothetical protein [Bacillus sp. AFS017274]|nr:hypothetical protein [Bacillus sp. AFS017274]
MYPAFILVAAGIFVLSGALLAIIVLCTIVLYYLLYARRHQKIQNKEIA